MEQQWGGVSVAVHPILGNYMIPKSTFVDKWGRWTGMEIHGQATEASGPLVVIGVYGPTGNDRGGDNTMWVRQRREMERLPEGERQVDPREQFLHDLKTVVLKYRMKHYRVVIAGDFNLNWRAESNQRQRMQRFLTESQTTHIHAGLWPRDVCSTWWGATGAWRVVMGVLFPRGMYRGTYGTVTEKEIEKMAASLRAVMRKHAKVHTSFPSDLLAGEKQLGGLGIGDFSDAVHINKLTVVEVLLRTGGVARQVMKGALHRAAQTVGTPNWTGKPWQCEAWTASGEWMGELLAWATPKGMGINGGSALDLEASGVEMGDPLIMDLPHMGGADLVKCRENGIWSAAAVMELKGRTRKSMAGKIAAERLGEQTRKYGSSARRCTKAMAANSNGGSEREIWRSGAHAERTCCCKGLRNGRDACVARGGGACSNVQVAAWQSARCSARDSGEQRRERYGE